jgi:parallel beta-helix repeat protein
VIILLVGINIVPLAIGSQIETTNINKNVRIFNSETSSLSNNIWYVDDDPGADFTKIQDAIDASNGGDIIIVYEGLYQENLQIKKSIKLIGWNESSTIIDGNNIGNAIYIESSNVEIERFTIQNSGGSEYDGIVINKESGETIREITIQDCIIKDNNNGIVVNNRLTDLIIISRCIIEDNSAFGIYVDKADIEKIYGCLIQNNGGGIHLFDSSFTLIVYNNISNNNGHGMYIDGTDWIVNGAIFIMKNHITYNKGAGLYFHGSVWIVFINQNNFIANLGDQITIEINNYNNLIYMNLNHWDPEGDGVGLAPFRYVGRIGIFRFLFIDSRAKIDPYPY